MSALRTLVLTACLTAPLAVATPAWSETTTTVPAHCSDGHGSDGAHNPHCESTTTTEAATTTTTPLPDLLSSTTTTTATETPRCDPTCSTGTTAPALAIEPPHLTIPGLPTTTTTGPAAVAGTTEQLPVTGIPVAFLGVCAALALLFGLALRYAGRMERR